MFNDMIQQLRDYCKDLEEKQCKKLNVEQLGNMLCVLSDKGLIDGSQRAEKVQAMIEVVYQELMKAVDVYTLDRKQVKTYNKMYAKLVAEVKDVYGLEARGSIQSRYMAMGIAIGTGIGSALMTVINPASLSIGIALGVAVGLSIGSRKEKEAKDAGKLY